MYRELCSRYLEHGECEYIYRYRGWVDHGDWIWRDFFGVNFWQFWHFSE